MGPTVARELLNLCNNAVEWIGSLLIDFVAALLWHSMGPTVARELLNLCNSAVE